MHLSALARQLDEGPEPCIERVKCFKWCLPKRRTPTACSEARHLQAGAGLRAGHCHAHARHELRAAAVPAAGRRLRSRSASSASATASSWSCGRSDRTSTGARISSLSWRSGFTSAGARQRSACRCAVRPHRQLRIGGVGRGWGTCPGRRFRRGAVPPLAQGRERHTPPAAATGPASPRTTPLIRFCRINRS